MNPNDTNLYEFLDDPARRRFWLLIKALESAPLGEAVALAKSAEAFVTGGTEALQERGAADGTIALQLPAWVH
jgi:hypothetical protein